MLNMISFLKMLISILTKKTKNEWKFKIQNGGVISGVHTISGLELLLEFKSRPVDMGMSVLVNLMITSNDPQETIEDTRNEYLITVDNQIQDTLVVADWIMEGLTYAERAWYRGYYRTASTQKTSNDTSNQILELLGGRDNIKSFTNGGSVQVLSGNKGIIFPRQLPYGKGDKIYYIHVLANNNGSYDVNFLGAGKTPNVKKSLKDVPAENLLFEIMENAYSGRTASTQKTSNEIGNQILELLGGNRTLKMMAGAKQFVGMPNGVQIHIPRTGKGIGLIMITLNGSDSYDLKFYSPFSSKTFDRKVKSSENDVPVEKLLSTVEYHTGLSLRVPKIEQIPTPPNWSLFGRKAGEFENPVINGADDVINLLGGEEKIKSMMYGSHIARSNKAMGGIIFSVPLVFGVGVEHIGIFLNDLGTYNIDFYGKMKSTTPNFKKRLINIPADKVKMAIAKYAKLYF